MGLFDWFTGTKRPASGTVPRSAQEVRAALLGVNGPDKPFTARDGRAEGVDLVAEWKIADVRWYGYFGNVTTVNRTLMRIDESKREVRSVDEEWSVTWIGGTPRLQLAGSHTRGQINKKSYSATFTRDEAGNLVKERQQSFSSAELKPPLQHAVTSAGWTWRGVVAGKL
ncbi:hypothetical protein QFW96_02530 [Saccharopolyspora sp. TS4A08]|uniref:Uncharacterized protein n=1 Tax=Saccharopolyspora ipomoeae TaxID=3042027 RepID=A0ABT6PHZ5_9PSEU|nr:hypothetical protein [Saccharopolyspora sp. TS4A08]MDI2027465.1 hypothetical protein [Saccharopolyspora sp. TS4A08]